MEVAIKRFEINISSSLSEKFIEKFKSFKYRKLFQVKKVGGCLQLECIKSTLDFNQLISKLKNFVHKFNNEHNLDALDSAIIFSEDEIKQTEEIISRLVYL